jgi:hypothetical protein
MQTKPTPKLPMVVEIKPARFIQLLAEARKNDARHPWLRQVDFWLSTLVASSDEAVILELR